MGMIDRVKIQNYKSLKDVEITFDSRLPVLVGENGSGKSSVLRCIHAIGGLTGFLPNEAWTRLLDEFNETYDGVNSPQILSVEEKQEDGWHGIRYISANYNHRKQIVNQPNLLAITPRVTQSAINRDDDGEISSEARYRWKLSFVPVELVGLKSESLSKPSQTFAKYIGRSMPMDGTALASWVTRFIKSDYERFKRVECHFCQLIPNIKAIRVRDAEVSGSEIAGDELIFDLPKRKGVPASQMSDGTLYALGLIVKILDPQRPKTLLIDDIDHGFHPKAQTQLVELIKKLLEEFPDLQIIATSHSPYILSGIEWNEVRVLHLRDDGTTVIRPLTDHPNYEKWGGSMNPGEFWSHAGEEWADIKPGSKASSNTPELVAS